MGTVADRLLALIVFKGGKLYLRRRYGRFVPSRRATVLGLLGVVVASAAAAALRRLGGPAAS